MPYSLRLDPGTRLALAREADRRGLTLAAVIREFIEDRLAIEDGVERRPAPSVMEVR